MKYFTDVHSKQLIRRFMCLQRIKMQKIVAAFIYFTYFTIGFVVSQECPSEDPPFPIFFPHETNCSLFYECSGGYKILQSCPPDLHFNPKENVCDFPEHAGCAETLKLRSACPSRDPPYPVYFPHETNCHLFYQCSNGQKNLHTCPANLHFNPRSKVCDYPDRAGCTSGRPKSSECPLEDLEFPVYFRHETRCDLFYQCSHGSKVLHKCPPNQHFNVELNVCDIPENAHCELEDVEQNQIVYA